jgi:hypothetical protein
MPRFTPPTVNEKWGRHPLFSRISTPVGVTVLRLVANTFVEVRDPTPEELSTALDVYVGGRTHDITEEQANRLTVAGYGAYIEPD